ncbi:DUF917 domain-containing protein [Ancylobacter sp. SL191]|uniref:DUF917 domain-containing protein n=1 Tax=Ancylobacter sp. SL191 TaxID=2995166 RepID=UPI00226EB134|nr:DUF917 domain-containing protein [Ancylobacter sp. SL191]WAC26548.1 DUF917 domain-containing protein [Ancylobacter sp. SL191]
MSSSALEELFRGLVFYGTGGGGRAEAGLALLRGHFGADWTPRFTAPADLPPESHACATIVIGGRDPDKDIPIALRAALNVPEADLAIPLRFARAVQALERATGTEIAALAVVELGSLAMAATLVAADMLGKAVLDCDGTGRSIPELGLAKLDLVGLSPAPAALVDRFGNETVLLTTSGASMTDRLARQINAAVYGRGLACAGYLAPLSAFAAGLVPGSVATAQEIGTILSGTGEVSQRLEALFARTGGRLLFKGTTTKVHWRSAEPYRFRDLDYYFAGLDGNAGDSFRIWVKNEHHLVWRSDELIASSPDPIAVLDASTLEPLTTLGDVEPGREVVAVVVPALDAIWRTPAGIERLGPARLGFEAGRSE